MKFNIEPVKNWFGFTRRERRASFLLLLIVIFVLALRFTVPLSNTSIEFLSDTIPGTNHAGEFSSDDTSTNPQLFSFDPNNAPYDTLIKLGLAVREANTLINYRNSGARFRQPEDIKKVYGLDEGKAEKLIPFVEINNKTQEPERKISGWQKKPPIDINSCDSAALVTLPGIGPVFSSRIIKYRRLLGGFVSVDQLKEVYGLPVETFELIKGRVYADSSKVSRISINTAGYKELSRLPYFEKYEVTAILKYRELKGRLISIDDLTDNKLLTAEKASKVSPYLNFE